MKAILLPRSCLFATTILLSASTLAAQDTPINGARISIIEKPSSGIAVTLENLRDTPLVAWEIGLLQPGTTEPQILEAADFADFTGPIPSVSDFRPLARGEQRVVKVPSANDADGVIAVITLAVFEDGFYEGQPASIEKLRQRRRDHGLGQPLTVNPAAGSDVVSARVSSAALTEGGVYAVIENLRGSAIEAIGFRAMGTSTSDHCTSGETPPGVGRILPGEKREVWLSPAAEAPARPEATLTFVLFEDLKAEGQRVAIAELLQRRQRQADDAAFMIAALTEAVRQPPERVLEFLETQKRERLSAAAATKTRLTSTYELDLAIDRAKAVPHEVAGFARELTASLERKRFRLSRFQIR